MASAAPTGSSARSRTLACRRPCRPCWRRGSTGSAPRRSGCCRPPRWRARRSASGSLALVAGFDDGAEGEAALRELIDAGFLYELELYPERILAFRHPLTREVAYGTQLAEQRAATHAAVARAMIELNPDRHEELAALIANHLEEGGETLEAARWAARAAHWAGNSRPNDALRLWRSVTELVAKLDPSPETDALALSSRLLQLDYAWRLGMERDEVARLEAEAEEIATRIGDLRSLALLRILASARPGLEQATGDWIAEVEEANRLADESGDDYLRVAIRTAGAYAYLCAADFETFDRTADEILELAGDDHEAGAGIIVGCPFAWALWAKAMVCRERNELEQCEKLLERSLRIAEEQGDPETASWTRGSKAMLLALQGNPEAGVAIGRRNCELTERLGDVFSRSLALGNLGTAQLAAEDYEAALESFEEAERLHREAAGGGDEQEAWRAAVRAEALTGVGRAEEAAEIAAWAAEIARKRELRWSLPLALLALARARAAGGQDGAREALDEAATVAGARRSADDPATRSRPSARRSPAPRVSRFRLSPPWSGVNVGYARTTSRSRGRRSGRRGESGGRGWRTPGRGRRRRPGSGCGAGGR